MKSLKVILAVVCVVVLFMATGLYAQTSSEFGVKAGLGFTKNTGDITGVKSLFTFAGGGVLRITPSRQFSIQPEALITVKGSKENNPGGTEDNLKLTYFEVPALLMYRPSTGAGSVTPEFYVGPSLGVLLSAKAAGVDVKDAFKSTDFGLVVGGGVDFLSGPSGKLCLDARYAIGLSNIAKDSGPYSVKNSQFLFNVSYLFGSLGK